MTTFIIRRLFLAIIVLIIISFISFLLLYIMPGDPAATVLGLEARPEQIEALRHELWLDRPFIIQYVHWVGNALQGDLGNSLAYQMPVSSIFAQRLPITLYLALWAFLLSNTAGIVRMQGFSSLDPLVKYAGVAAGQEFAGAYLSQEFVDTYNLATQAPDFETKQKLVWQLMEIATDKDCIAAHLYVQGAPIAKNKRIHDDGYAVQPYRYLNPMTWLSE